jgi:hypothetical protein
MVTGALTCHHTVVCADHSKRFTGLWEVRKLSTKLYYRQDRDLSKHTRDDIRSEIRSTKDDMLTHVADVQTSLKRQVQQVDASTREVGGQLRDFTRVTKEQIEDAKGQVRVTGSLYSLVSSITHLLPLQSTAIMAQLKRSVVEYQVRMPCHYIGT